MVIKDGASQIEVVAALVHNLVFADAIQESKPDLSPNKKQELIPVGNDAIIQFDQAILFGIANGMSPYTLIRDIHKLLEVENSIATAEARYLLARHQEYLKAKSESQAT